MEQMPQFLERDLEDWVCENLDIVTGDPDARLVARQLVLPYGGRLDALALIRDGDWVRWVVIEVKRGEVRRRDVSQLLEYMGCIDEVQSAMDWGRLFPRYNKLTGGLALIPIDGVMVAPSMRDDAHRAVTAVPNVSFFQLDPASGEWDNGEYVPFGPSDEYAHRATQNLYRRTRAAIAELVLRDPCRPELGLTPKDRRLSRVGAAMEQYKARSSNPAWGVCNGPVRIRQG